MILYWAAFAYGALLLYCAPTRKEGMMYSPYLYLGMGIMLWGAWNISPVLAFLAVSVPLLMLKAAYVRVGLVFGLFMAVMFVSRNYAQVMQVQTSSMRPTINPGAVTLVIRNQQPARNDLAAFIDPMQNVMMVKRVVGVAGDKLVFEDGMLIRNGERLTDETVLETGEYSDIRKHSYAVHAEGTHQILLEPGALSSPGQTEECSYEGRRIECTVPQGRVFVAGDNRHNSKDSRHFGSVVPVGVVKILFE